LVFIAILRKKVFYLNQILIGLHNINIGTYKKRVLFCHLGIYYLDNHLGVKFMQERSRIKWSSLVIGVIFLIIGVFILSFPEENLFAITWLIGLLFIINGFLEIFVRRVMKKTDKNASTIVLVLGVINIILGLLILFNIVTSTTFIVYLFAIWFIINALFNMFTVTPLEKSNKGFHIVSVILNIITVVFGIILLFNPLMAAILVAIFMSAVFFIIGITYIIRALS